MIAQNPAWWILLLIGAIVGVVITAVFAVGKMDRLKGRFLKEREAHLEIIEKQLKEISALKFLAEFARHKFKIPAWWIQLDEQKELLAQFNYIVHLASKYRGIVLDNPNPDQKFLFGDYLDGKISKLRALIRSVAPLDEQAEEDTKEGDAKCP